MDSTQQRRLLFKICVIALLLQQAATSSRAHAAAETPEQRLVRTAKNLRPISDSQWNEIAGSKISEQYEIQKGDTLWDVSKRLFGNAFYWPKVWSLNHGIRNPHVIAPGQKLAFTQGTSESLPQLAPSTASAAPAMLETPLASVATSTPTTSEAPPQVTSSGPREYEKLSPDQWAPVDPAKFMQKDYDAYGLDKDLKITLPARFAFRVPAIANDTTVPFLGEIDSSRREGVGLSQGDTVFLKSNSHDLQVGTTYSVFSEPEFVRERKSDRSGYVYRSIGEIRVIGVKDELYIGIIVKAYDVIKRGDRIYPLLPMISDIKPQPGRTALEALAVVGNSQNTRNTAQFRFIHLDRGIEDGVNVGNVFRIYEYHDPTTRKKITDSDFLMNADALVVHATAQFSTALVIRSRDTFGRGDFGVLLTDVSDIEKQIGDRTRGFGESEQRSPEDKELDELDELDKSSGEGLGKKEETEIKELDQWDKTKDLQVQPHDEPTMPSAAETPTDDLEKIPGQEPEPVPTSPSVPRSQEPTLDQTLDGPTVTPPETGPPPPPADLKAMPEQTLDTPAPPPVPQEADALGDPYAPQVEPMVPETAPAVEPAQSVPPDDVESKTP